MRRTVLLSALALALTACANKPVPVSFQAVADEALNLDEQGRPLSLVFRVYQLRDSESFQRLNYESLNEGKPDSDLFGNSLISRSEHVLLPGQQASLPTEIAPEAQFVGVVGFFRRPDEQQWRFLFDRKTVLKSGLTVHAHSCHMQFATPAPLPIPGQDLQRVVQCPAIVVAKQEEPAIKPQAAPAAGGKKKSGKSKSATAAPKSEPVGENKSRRDAASTTAEQAQKLIGKSAEQAAGKATSTAAGATKPVSKLVPVASSAAQAAVRTPR